MKFRVLPAGVCALVLLFVPAAHGAGRCGDRAQRPWCDTSLSPDARAGLLLAQLTQDEKISLLAGDDPFGVGGDANSHTGTSDGIDRVGLPNTYYSDGPVGPRQGTATAMPVPMALAATFDQSLARLHGGDIANEAKNKGNDVVFAPTVNIMRTPLGGRTFEAYGEDPFLDSRMAVGWIEGAQAQGVIANVKHFAANNQEGSADQLAQASGPGAPIGAGPFGSRYISNSIIDERTLREIYLPHFEAAVKEANVGSIMCSYNKLNGQYACENDHLLQQILEREWGFKGYVLADYGADHNTIQSLNNGLDFEPWPGFFAYSPAQVNVALAAQQVSPSTIDDHIRRILRTDFAYGFFDRPAYVNDDNQIDKAAHLRDAGRIEESGITLMKNDGVLPIDSRRVKSIAIIGSDADGFKTGGGSADVKPFSVVTPRDAITRRAGSGIKVSYDPGDNADQAAGVARDADIALVFASDFETEGIDKACMTLECGNSQRGDQDGLIDKVRQANPNTVVVLETGAPVLTPWRNQVKGILEAWYPGSDGGDALARVLFGDVDASGRLPVTFPQQESDIPTAGDPEKYPGNVATGDVFYKEGLDVGYRWYDAKNITPAFPFGFGLSYTTFAYSNLTTSADAVSVTVTNTGKRTGIAVPQLYLGFPQAAGEPPKQLKGFQKVSLAPGKSQRVTFPLDSRSFSHWDTAAGTWSITPGCYDVLVGDSSRDIREQGQISQGGARCAGAASSAAAGACAAGAGFRIASAKPSGRGLRFSFSRGSDRPVQVDVRTFSHGRRVTGGGLVARFAGESGPFDWNGRPNRALRRLRDGYYEVRFQVPTGNGNFDTRLVGLVRRHGRFRAGPKFAARDSCGLLRSFRLTRPVFGGTNHRPLVANYRLGSRGRVELTVLRGKRVVARYRAKKRRAGRIYRVSVKARGGLARRGRYTVRLRAVAGKRRAGGKLSADAL